MYESSAALLKKIRLGESSFLELKEVRFAGAKIRGPSRDALADTLAAFANARGGVLVLGVEDKTRAILGIPEGRIDSVVDLIREVCRDAIDPPLDHATVECLELPSGTDTLRPVIRVDVPRSISVHRSPGGFLLRVFNSTRVMAPDQLARLFQQRGSTRLVSFEEQVVSAAGMENLDPELWERFRTPLSDADPHRFLSKLGMAGVDQDGTHRPTIAGLLLASRDPHRWVTNAFIQAVAYRGSSIRISSHQAYQLDASDITGPLDRQVFDACRFVARNMKTAAFKGGERLGRRDVPQYDLSAVFEALVNAVAHRDYSLSGSKIRLRLFADSLLICSPGNLANSMKVENLPYLQSSRNNFVCSLLAKCALPDEEWLTSERQYCMDKRGEGVPIILAGSERLSGRAPEYSLIDDRELQLTIYAAEV